MFPPKPWQPFTGRVSDAETAEAIELHALRLGDGEHRVRHESVVAEHGVIVPRAHAAILLRAGAA